MATQKADLFWCHQLLARFSQAVARSSASTAMPRQ